jgi:cell shape-determining protein MreD
MKRRAQIISIILHAILLTVTYVFQDMIFPYLRLAGLAPLLLPVVSTGVAVYEGRHVGGLFGMFAGILCDVSFGQPAALFTVLLTVTGLLVGILADTVVTRGFATFIISCAAVLVVCAFAQMFPLLFSENGPVPPRPLIETAFRQTVYSLVYAFPIWFFVRALGDRAQRLSSSGRQL